MCFLFLPQVLSPLAALNFKFFVFRPVRVLVARIVFLLSFCFCLLQICWCLEEKLGRGSPPCAYPLCRTATSQVQPAVRTLWCCQTLAHAFHSWFGQGDYSIYAFLVIAESRISPAFFGTIHKEIPTFCCNIIL